MSNIIQTEHIILMYLKCMCTYVSTINEKRGNEFEKYREWYIEDLEKGHLKGWEN